MLYPQPHYNSEDPSSRLLKCTAPGSPVAVNVGMVEEVRGEALSAITDTGALNEGQSRRRAPSCFSSLCALAAFLIFLSAASLEIGVEADNNSFQTSSAFLPVNGLVGLVFLAMAMDKHRHAGAICFNTIFRSQSA